MWFLFQCVIVFAVGASNIAYRWTPNPYVAGLIGIGAAYGATLLVLTAKERISQYQRAKRLN